ncbi:hypothetical protein H5410_021436, partial [Solanum commersonii]
HLNTFVELELAFEASIVSLKFFEKKARGSPKPLGESRMALTSSNVPMCQALKEKIKSAIEESSQRVAKRFRDAVLHRPKL